MSARTLKLDDSLLAYLVSDTLREPPILRELREETSKLPQANLQIAPEQGQLMALLVELMGARRALEIGVFTGYSALTVALAMPGDGSLVACDVSDEWTAVARRYWERAGVAGRISLELRPALDTLAALLAQGAAGTFDFAFIDADKANYGLYYEHTLALLRPGGLLAVDNALWNGKVADLSVIDEDTTSIRELNERAHHDPRVTTSLVPIGDGLLLARKR